MSNIACPQCGAAVSGDRVNIATLLAHCPTCDHVFRFDGQIGATVTQTISPFGAAGAALGLPLKPERFRVSGGEMASVETVSYREIPSMAPTPLVVRWRWFTGQAVFLLFFSLAWDAFLVFWYGIGLATGGPWIMFVFPLAHVAVGVGITYSAVSRLLNATTVTLDANELRSVTAPIRNPFKKQVALARASVASIAAVQRYQSRSSIRYDVVAYEPNGQAHVVASFEAHAEAEYLAQRLERQRTLLMGATAPAPRLGS